MFPLLRSMAATLHRPRVGRIAVNELLVPSDLALQDIGIHRSQIRPTSRPRSPFFDET